MNNRIKARPIIFLLFSFWAFSIHSEVVQYKCINKLKEVLPDLASLPNKEGSIVVFDWDSTVAKWIDHSFRAFEAREPQADGTMYVINALQQQGFKMMVLTARLGGFKLADTSRTGQTIQKDAEMHLENMITLLGKEKWERYGALRPKIDAESGEKRFQELAIDDAFEKSGDKIVRQYYMIAKNSVAFVAGGPGINVKGKTLKQLVNNNDFVVNPKNIVFIDDDKTNTEEVSEVLKDIAQKVYIYHYPKPDKPCQ